MDKDYGNDAKRGAFCIITNIKMTLALFGILGESHNQCSIKVCCSYWFLGINR